jgi:hypothetical protein
MAGASVRQPGAGTSASCWRRRCSNQQKARSLSVLPTGWWWMSSAG